MKTKTFLVVVIAMAACVVGARAQNFGIDWFTLDGGGGVSSGGAYSLSGTIGQSDSGNLSGGSYFLEGGFWGGAIAVQPQGAPTLTITRAGGSAVIAWAPATPGFVLQTNGNLAPGGWADAPSAATNPVTVPATGIRFYRLRK